MPIKMELVRSPKSLKRKSVDIRKEIEESYNRLGREVVQRASQDVENWEERPDFKVTVTMTSKRYTLKVKYDGRTTGGKRYTWVDRGTASYREKGGGRKKYIIKPREASGIIKYNLPSAMPKTMAADGSLAHSYTDAPGVIRAKQVIHPGIKPRKFLVDYQEYLQSRKSGSFHNVTEAAIKRGLRRSARTIGRGKK